MYFLLFICLFFHVVISWELVEKRFNDKNVIFVYKNSSTSSIAAAKYINGNLYVLKLNYSRGVVSRKFNNQGFIIGPKGDNVTNSITAREIYESFRRSYNTTYNASIGLNNDYMIITGYGPYCGMPLVTHVNVKTSLIFNNSFIYYNELASDDTAEQEVFTNGSYKIVVMANAYQNYSIQWYQALTLLDQVVNLTSYPSLSNVTYTFVSGNNYTLNKIDGDWMSIIPPILPTEINFFKNKLNPFYYASSSANYHQGGLDSNLQEQQPYTVSGVIGGGSVSFTTGENPRIPVAIPPNPLYKPYKDHCNDFYPRDTEFLAFGILDNNGNSYERMQQNQEMCFAPFYAPELIISDSGTEVLDERYRQCFYLGGQLTEAQDACYRPIAWAYCDFGWYYFGGKCFYKYNPITEAAARVVLDQSTITCRALRSDIPIQALTYVSYDEDAWLRGSYVYINLDQQNVSTSPYRIPVVNTICRCYYPGNATSSCNCQVPAFPICYYNVEDYEVIDRWIRHSPKTIAVLRDGQSGAQWNGEMFNVDCYNGWCNSSCQTACCPFPTSENPNDPQSIFFGKCYSNGRGSCEDNDPRACKCKYGYTPPANLITGENVEYPCPCPGIPAYNDLSIINNVTYNLSHSACGGRWQGTCYVDLYSNTGECDCIQRTRLAKYFNLEKEYAYNGKSCASRVPRVFEFTDIEQTICNNKGTSCPFGERADGSIDNYCPLNFHGCYCDNGWSGEACTCFTPFNLKNAFPVARRPILIQFVWCSSDYFLIDGLAHGCTKYEDEKFYCGPRFIKTITNCTSLEAVYEEWFDVGGNYTNPFSGRFSARKENRYYNNYLETQPWYYATKGCTNSYGMCDSNHTGLGCFMGISNTVTKAVCGETTLPKRGKALPNNKCGCNELGQNGYFYDAACENFVFNYRVCNGHGTPTNVNFPYGTCSGDIHLNDSLNDPFYFVQNDLNRFNPWLFKEASLISDLTLNKTYYFRDTFTTVYMEKVYGSNFTTCLSSIKLVMPLSMDAALVEVVTLNLTLASGSNVIVPVLRGYAQCTGLDQATFYDGTITRPNCYTSYRIIRNNGEVLSLSVSEKNYEVTCVNAQTVEPLINYPYGKLYCNNAYQRNIDKALWIFLGEDNYTLQCQHEPIKPYDTPDFYGLFEEYNATRVELALGNRNVSLDDLNEKFFDDYLISWVTPYVNRTLGDINIGSLGSAVTFNTITELLLFTFELLTTNIMYDFLDERWFFSNATGIGSAYRAGNASTYYQYFTLERNYSFIYRLPGFMLYLPTYRRKFQNVTNLSNTTVNALIITPPINLESMSIYARNGTLCGHILYPRANRQYTVSCGFDPFLYDAEYEAFIAYLSQAINQSSSLEEATIYMKALTTEGVRVNIVPENFYGIELSVANSFSVNYTDHCIYPFTNFSYPTNDQCHYFEETSTQPNYGNYYFNDWFVNQGWVPVTDGNGTINNFFYWFNLAFAQAITDFTIIWQNIDDLPLNPNVDQSLPILNCVTEDRKCRIIWGTWLAPRKCTFDEECSNNGIGEFCVFSDAIIPAIGWRQGNGDRSLGIEGGCLCDFSYERGFFTQFCDICVGGMGPFDNCTLPIAREMVCGVESGYSLNVTQYNESFSLQVVGNKVPACLDITYDDVKYYLVDDSFIWLQKPGDFLVSYMDADFNIINIINDQAWYNGLVISDEVTHCTKYKDDAEYFKQYFDENEHEVEFVSFQVYISFIN